MDYKYSNIWQRLADFYLSCFFHILITGLIVLIVTKAKILDLNLFTPEFWIFSLWVFLGFHLLETLVESLSGAGIAKQILGMRLMDANSLGSIGIVRALLRTVFALFSFLLLGLGYLAIAFNREHKSLHDLLTGARVVNTPKSGFAKIFSIFMTVVSVIPGLLISLALLTALSTIPLGAGKSLVELTRPSSFALDLFATKPELAITLPYKQKRIAALTEFNNLEFIEYELDPLGKYNYVQPSVLRLIGVKPWDYDFMLTNWQDDLTQAQLKIVVLIPKLIFKDSEDRDLVVYNQKFIIDPAKTQLGSDLLDLFDYQINEKTQNLTLSLHPEDRETLANQDLDDDAKKYLLYVFRSIRSNWQDYLGLLSPSELAELVSVEDSISNTLIFDFDTKDGYIKHAAINEPSKNETFNKICERFIGTLPRFRNLPVSLKEIGLYSFKMDLRYQEVIDEEARSSKAAH